MQRLRSAVNPAIALAIALIFSAGIADAQTKITPGFNLFSTQDDVQIGQQSMQQALQQLPIVNDSQINSYVNRIGQNLAPVVELHPEVSIRGGWTCWPFGITIGAGASLLGAGVGVGLSACGGLEAAGGAPVIGAS